MGSLCFFIPKTSAEGAFLLMNTNIRLSADVFTKLVDAFKENEWDIPNESAGNESRFNRFCERLSILDTKEQLLVIELTKRFKVIDSSDYFKFIIELLNDINQKDISYFQQTNNFYILPLIAPKDFNKTKSSNFVWYYFRSEEVKYHPLFLGKQLKFIEPANTTALHSLNSSDSIILVDDYVGSGDTAKDAIEWLTTNSSVLQEKIVILSIAAQNAGINYINNDLHVPTYALHKLPKGISDYYTSDALENHTQTMKAIERKLKVRKKFKFGYNRSEGLISLIRTPNNTFPVFWQPHSANMNAPFSRD